MEEQEQENQGVTPASKQEVKREIVEFVKMIAWFLVLFWVVRSYVIEGYEVQGPSMIPTLQDGERILVLKLPHVLSRTWLFGSFRALDSGDIVVFDSPVESNKRYVKRLVARGVPGQADDTVRAEGNGGGAPGRDLVGVRFDRGAVYVNNKRIEEDYLQPEQKTVEESFPEVRLTPGTYYVLGDNRQISRDSRNFGPITDDCVIGKALVCFWPPSHVRLLR